MSDSEKHHLPRLNRHFYQGDAVVFWTNTIEQKSRGWLTAGFHSAFREIMLHAAAREQLLCPAYCLMPDHLHLVWMGFSRETDQLNAMAFVRKHLKPPLREGTDWQHQAHDHVLREEERKRNAFATFCSYTLANPVRAGLAESAERWPFSGAIVPGFPALNPFGQDYWETFWKIYVQKREKDPRLHGS